MERCIGRPGPLKRRLSSSSDALCRDEVRRRVLRQCLLALCAVPGGIHHCVVVVRDLEASLRFYRDGLQRGGRSRPAGSQPMVVPPSRPFGTAVSFFSARNSSVAFLLFHSTESPAFVT